MNEYYDEDGERAIMGRDLANNKSRDLHVQTL